MRIACLQFSPTLGDRASNMAKATSLLSGTSPGTLDLLVLPELAFSGYNFPSLEAITPFLEPTASGPSTAWAIATAKHLHCTVTVGYPERSTTTDTTSSLSSSSPTSSSSSSSSPTSTSSSLTRSTNYNALVTVAPDGAVVASYRKAFLYYTDETWASEGDAGFYAGGAGGGGATAVCMGICMDINPRRFEAPWTAYEFATHCVRAGAPLVVLSMAWLTRLQPAELATRAAEPDVATLTYWVERLTPLVQSEGAEGVVVVLANRCGTEPGRVAGVTQGVGDDGEDVVGYAGSSCVLRVGGGKAVLFDVLGRAQEGLLFADTTELPKFSLQQRAPGGPD